MTNALNSEIVSARVDANDMKLSSAKLIVEALRKNEVPFIGVLPDGWLFEAYQLVCEDPYFKVVQVTHEGEGVSICAGAWAGGMRSAMMMENSGLRAAAEALGRLYCYPVLLLMSYRGDFGDSAYFGRPIGRTTEPILDALEIPYAVVRKEEEIEKSIQEAVRTLDTAHGPVALLFSGDTVR